MLLFLLQPSGGLLSWRYAIYGSQMHRPKLHQPVYAYIHFYPHYISWYGILVDTMREPSWQRECDAPRCFELRTVFELLPACYIKWKHQREEKKTIFIMKL